jgi:hypothetical protein
MEKKAARRLLPKDRSLTFGARCWEAGKAWKRDREGAVISGLAALFIRGSVLGDGRAIFLLLG